MSTTEIIIVGGSLAGLSLALACARRGMHVRVLERSEGRVTGGDSLSVDLDVVTAVVGHDPRVEPVLPVVPAYRELTTWPALYNWLRDLALATSAITLEEGKTVVQVETLGTIARATLDDGTQRTGAVIIGADGYRSTVRQAITPKAPYARYAGYLVWRGLVEESSLSQPVSWPSDGGLWIDLVGGYRLVAAVLPGRDGSMEPGRRQVTFAWFDVHHNELVRRSGCLTPEGEIVGTLGRRTIDETVRNELAALTPQLWPEVWAEAVAVGVSSSEVLSGAPIAEYKPTQLASGLLAIIGDAAHVVSPMTGRGFLTGVEDGGLLARILADRQPGNRAFKHYNNMNGFGCRSWRLWSIIRQKSAPALCDIPRINQEAWHNRATALMSSPFVVWCPSAIAALSPPSSAV